MAGKEAFVHEEQAHMDVSQDTFPKTTPFLDRLAVGVRALEEWYAADFERRVTEITGVLRTQISDELRAQFTTELNASAERTRKQFEERAYMQFERWEAERVSMKKEIEQLQSQLPGKALLNEIAVTESALGRSQAECRSEAERDTASADALGQLLQKKAQQLEIQAYLRGLKFAIETTQQSRGNGSGMNEIAPAINPSMTSY
jgi:hypothetical protein